MTSFCRSATTSRSPRRVASRATSSSLRPKNSERRSRDCVSVAIWPSNTSSNSSCCDRLKRRSASNNAPTTTAAIAGKTERMSFERKENLTAGDAGARAQF